MSVVRIGATKQYSDNWENIFSGGRSSASKSAKKSKAKSKAAKKSPKKATKCGQEESRRREEEKQEEVARALRRAGSSTSPMQRDCVLDVGIPQIHGVEDDPARRERFPCLRVLDRYHWYRCHPNPAKTPQACRIFRQIAVAAGRIGN